MRNGLPNGVGTIYYQDGNQYTGEVVDGKPQGTVTFLLSYRQTLSSKLYSNFLF